MYIFLDLIISSKHNFLKTCFNKEILKYVEQHKQYYRNTFSKYTRIITD